jgi:hypothetical protein
MTDPKPIGADDITALPGGELTGAARVKRAMAAARAVMLEQRAMVLSHPDLAARLVSELGYTRASNWNGYVPPDFTAEGERNQSYHRDVLTEITMEAWNREHPDAPAGSGKPGPAATAPAAANSSLSEPSLGSSPGPAGAMSFPASSETAGPDEPGWWNE